MQFRMKGILLAGLISGVMVAFASQASAAPYGMAGCGLGALVFKDQPGKIQILSATINNIISPQTSAITSGTSNCVDSDSRMAAQTFINVNHEALKKDVSRGRGETLTSLSRFYNCSDASQFGTALQQKYETIFPSEKAAPSEIDGSIMSTIKGNAQLAQTCRA